SDVRRRNVGFRAPPRYEKAQAAILRKTDSKANPDRGLIEVLRFSEKRLPLRTEKPILIPSAVGGPRTGFSDERNRMKHQGRSRLHRELGEKPRTKGNQRI